MPHLLLTNNQMDSSPASLRIVRAFGKLAACVAGLSLALPAPAFADLLDQRSELINKFVNEMHADPIVADCAAHGSFIASTSSAFDRVDFAPNAFESGNATITPWNDSFDQGKQRVKVDNIVTVDGLGIHSDGSEPTPLKFRCGYVGQQMLAFSWNDPVPPLKPHVERPSSSTKKFKGKSHHGKVKAKASGRSGKKAVATKKSSGQKKAVKKKTAKKS
ncbi:BspC domain-containing protein [Burkholderia sp. 22313]|uniref:BspC domain-containing protein n=1 Tax=Burkholderia sp. 22313 TaxID=3453908 RepID=UPI003F83D48B